MTNLEYLTNKENIKELAKMLVQTITEPVYYYNEDEELEYIDDGRYYVTSDYARFDTYEYDKAIAIEHEIEWLLSERELNGDR